MTDDDYGADPYAPAFPWDGHGLSGITIRDYFAATAPTDEVQELQFRHLSRLAQERLVGRKYPEKPSNYNDPAIIAWQIDEFEFKCEVNAVIRYKMANAMLKMRWK